MSGKLSALVQSILPQHLISRITGWAARSRLAPVRGLLIGVITRLYRIDMSEAENPDLSAYESFNDLFTRALRAGARPVLAQSGEHISPADGVISQCGPVEDGLLLQAKGRHYTAAALLADESAGAHYRDGSFATIYLAPHNYHRVHAPIDGRLVRMTYIPGRLFSVSPSTTRSVDSLFARNERVVFHFETDSGPPCALVMVGALNVGSIETVHAGVIAPGPRRPQRWDYDQPPYYRQGDELARFNMGSTVILLIGHGGAVPLPELAEGSEVRVGERLTAQPIDAT